MHIVNREGGDPNGQGSTERRGREARTEQGTEQGPGCEAGGKEQRNWRQEQRKLLEAFHLCFCGRYTRVHERGAQCFQHNSKLVRPSRVHEGIMKV